MKTSAKILTAMFAIALVAAAKADTVIGSWQSAPIPPTPANDEGWQRGQGGFGADGSIFASSNYPAYFELKTNVAAGYAQSLDIHETGYGADRLYISLSADQIAAFTNNSQLNFTFSAPPGDTNTASGYIQLVQFQYNTPATGVKSISSGWNTSGFSETGDTNNNSVTGQPVFDYYTTAPARQQVVTWNYGNIVSNFVGASYVQFVWVFQTSGGELTNIYINNVTLSGASGASDTVTYTIDDFSPNGVGPQNPTNYDYYSTSNNYAAGQISNVWVNWFGAAFYTNEWDAASDASNNLDSGSLKITAIFPDAGIGGSSGAQFVVMDNYSGINPPLNGFEITNFQCDIRFDPSSATEVDGGTTNFGTVEFGSRGIDYGQHDFGSVNIAATNTGWVHVSIPVDAVSDASITNIPNVYVKMYSGTRTGTTILWVDNIKLVGPAVVATPTPPTLSLEKAIPGLRIFAGSTANTYDREELATVDQSQSWISPSSYPVSYSFKLLSYSANIDQTHIFLVPVNTSGQANMGDAGSVNEYIEYQASNTLWMIINPASNGVIASVQWKTNLPNANPNMTALIVTNSTAIGTWTLTFTSASAGTLTAPGASPVSFTVGDPNVSADFANPLVAYFGIQPNSTAGEGQYEDWAFISVSGVAGVNENEDFTTETTFNANGYWANNSAQATSIQLVTTNTPYWVSWSLPAVNFGLGTAMDIFGNTNTSDPWMLPEYYNGYNDGKDVPNQSQQGLRNWALIPATCLPTLDGNPGGPVSPNAFFRLFNPPLEN